uniref:Uncharacterized protein n=1 Tax=Arundo donax TaxID=35708 RepID=A0A0A9ETQ0_ARUDO
MPSLRSLARDYLIS